MERIKAVGEPTPLGLVGFGVDDEGDDPEGADLLFVHVCVVCALRRVKVTIGPLVRWLTSRSEYQYTSGNLSYGHG